MTTFFDAYGGMEALAANRQVSAEDVAREAGVSRTTVSFVINATPGKIISEETRRAVLDAVRKLGYRPNEDARRLALQRRFSVGLYIRHSSTFYNDSFLTRVVEGMVHTVNRHRVRLVVHPIHGGKIDCAMLAGEDEVDGIILVNTSEDDTTAGVCVDLPFPVVVMDPAGHVACDQVYISNDGGASEVVRYPRVTRSPPGSDDRSCRAGVCGIQPADCGFSRRVGAIGDPDVFIGRSTRGLQRAERISSDAGDTGAQSSTDRGFLWE
jgi:hypothetical protein